MKDFIQIISMVAVGSGTLLAFVIIYRSRHDRLSGMLLGFYMLSFCVGLAEPLLKTIADPKQHALLYEMLGAYTFLLGPFLYLYCKKRLTRKPIRQVDLKHFVPFVAYAYLVLTVRNTVAIYEIAVYELFILHVIIYCLLSINLYFSPQKSRSDNSLAVHLQFEFAKVLPRFSLFIFICLGVLSNMNLIIHWPFSGLVLLCLQFLLITYLFFIVILSPEMLEINDA